MLVAVLFTTMHEDASMRFFTLAADRFWGKQIDLMLGQLLVLDLITDGFKDLLLSVVKAVTGSVVV